MSVPAVEARELVKVYGTGAAATTVLRGVSFRIEEGEYVSLMGPSGSGKSTLMHIVGGLVRPTSGSCLLAGTPLDRLAPDQQAQVRNRMLGFVFQSFYLLAQLTALENVELPMIYAGVPAAQRRERARELLVRMGIGPQLGNRPSELSGGQRQRVAIARALANDPRLVVADEPTGNLDSRSAGEILEIFDELHAAGRTLLLVTHDPGVARRAQRTLHVRDGQLVSQEAAS